MGENGGGKDGVSRLCRGGEKAQNIPSSGLPGISLDQQVAWGLPFGDPQRTGSSLEEAVVVGVGVAVAAAVVAADGCAAQWLELRPSFPGWGVPLHQTLPHPS